jgi:hypothetical protein
MKTWMYAALASAALALAAPAANAATMVPLTPIDGVLTGTFTETVVTSGSTFEFTFTTSSPGTGSVSLEKTSLSGVNFVSAFLNDTIPFAFTSLFDAQFAATGPQFLQAGLQRITINTTGTGAFTGSIGFMAVPGPIAGAGLPVLMALGGFVWARRRKAAATA